MKFKSVASFLPPPVKLRLLSLLLRLSSSTHLASRKVGGLLRWVKRKVEEEEEEDREGEEVKEEEIGLVQAWVVYGKEMRERVGGWVKGERGGRGGGGELRKRFPPLLFALEKVEVGVGRVGGWVGRMNEELGRDWVLGVVGGRKEEGRVGREKRRVRGLVGAWVGRMEEEAAEEEEGRKKMGGGLGGFLEGGRRRKRRRRRRKCW